MNNIELQKSLKFARQLSGSANPYALCDTLGIEIVSDKPINNDGYLICEGGCKLIFVSSKVQNDHRKKFIISHEIGHFLLHRDQLYCCANILEAEKSSINTSLQEREANCFASEYLLPQSQLKEFIPKTEIHFSDISRVATHFDISMTFAAIRVVQSSNTENEILICYDGQKLKWFDSADRTLRFCDIPVRCPVDLSKTREISDITGAWDSLYEGSVHQEIFNPFGSQKLVLLSGIRYDTKEDYNES